MGHLLVRRNDKQMEGEECRDDRDMSMYGLIPSLIVPLEKPVCVPVDSVGRKRKR